MFESFSFIFLIAALLSYCNYRWLKLPSTIGAMILALGLVTLIIVSKNLAPQAYDFVCQLIIQADFKSLLLDIMLSFLLFAGAIHINLGDLQKERWPILTFATLGVLLSTLIIGFLFYLLAPVFGLEIGLMYCFLFGALISPTDPIAVLAILQKTKISKSLELEIEGESLFNDGVGVVMFTSVLLLSGNSVHSTGVNVGEEIFHIFMLEAVGGLAFGALLGWLMLKIIKTVEENGQLVLMLTIATVLGGYAIASMLGTSGPLAMVVCGLLMGNGINHGLFNEKSKMLINQVWKALDESLNVVLFVLIGLTIHLLDFQWNIFALGLLMILLILIARFISVYLPSSLFSFRKTNTLRTSLVLTWGGLRGGISIALALGLSENPFGKEILLICFMVVLFSIIVQGLTIEQVLKRLL